MRIGKTFLVYLSSGSIILHLIISLSVYYSLKSDEDYSFPSLFDTIIDWRSLAVFSFFFAIVLVINFLLALRINHSIFFKNIKLGITLNAILFIFVICIFISIYIPRNEYYGPNISLILISIFLLFGYFLIIKIAEQKPRLEQNFYDYSILILASVTGISFLIYLIFGAIHASYSHYVLAIISYITVIVGMCFPFVFRNQIAEIEISIKFDG